MQLLRLAGTAALIISSGLVAAAEVERPAPDESQIRSWIAGLANTSEPRVFDNPFESLTPMEKESLKPVTAAYINLSTHFLVSLPYLMESLNDRRYSYPREHPTSGVYENQTVGDACRSIIERKVLLQTPTMIDDRDIGVSAHLSIGPDWYKRVKGMSLFEMQVDALDEVLKVPRLERVSRDRWEEELREVSSFRKKFVAGGKAIDRPLAPDIEGR